MGSWWRALALRGQEWRDRGQQNAALAHPSYLLSAFRPLLSAVILSFHQYLWSTDWVPGMWVKSQGALLGACTTMISSLFSLSLFNWFFPINMIKLYTPWTLYPPPANTLSISSLTRPAFFNERIIPTLSPFHHIPSSPKPLRSVSAPASLPKSSLPMPPDPADILQCFLYLSKVLTLPTIASSSSPCCFPNPTLCWVSFTSQLLLLESAPRASYSPALSPARIFLLTLTITAMLWVGFCPPTLPCPRFIC